MVTMMKVRELNDPSTQQLQVESNLMRTLGRVLCYQKKEKKMRYKKVKLNLDTCLGATLFLPPTLVKKKFAVACFYYLLNTIIVTIPQRGGNLGLECDKCQFFQSPL